MPAGRRWIMSAIALALLYGNAMVALQPAELLELGLFIPHPEAVRNAFVLTAMFASDLPQNEDYLIQGRLAPADIADDQERWITLPLGEHLPRRHPITTMEIYAPYPQAIGGEPARQRAWTVMAHKIRARHNRLHPDIPVEQIRFGALQWPKDPRGYRAREVAGQTWLQLWFKEPLK
jgi:hypothetical protein